MLERDGWRCWLCLLPIEAIEDANLDHVKPRARGGTSAKENLRPAHVVCNSIRGSGDAIQSCIECRQLVRTARDFELHWKYCRARRAAQLLARENYLAKRRRGWRR